MKAGKRVTDSRSEINDPESIDLDLVYQTAIDVLSAEEKLELDVVIGKYEQNEDVEFSMRPIVYVAFKLYLVSQNIELYF